MVGLLLRRRRRRHSGAQREYMRGLSLKSYYESKLAAGMAETLEVLMLEDSAAQAGGGAGGARAGGLRAGFRLFECFAQVDMDGSGEIDMGEFYGFFKVRKSPFVRRIFGELDLDGSEELSFQEFAVGIWHFCTLSRSRMCQFALAIFDLDGLGTMDRFQCDALVRMVHDEEETPEDLAAAIVRDFGDRALSVEELEGFVCEHPGILAPAEQVQRSIRQRTFGLGFWKEQTLKRTDAFGELETIGNILLSKRREKRNLNVLLTGTGRAGTRRAQIGPAPTAQSTFVLSIETKGSASSHGQGQEGRGPAGAENKDAKPKDNIYDFGDDVEMTVTQTEALRWFHQVVATRSTYVEAAEAHRQSQLPHVRASAGDANGGDGESGSESRALLEAAAQAKQDFQTAAHSLEIAGSAGIDEAERLLYLHAINEVEEAAAAFFATEEGNEYLKAVGKEHALREDGSTNFLGIVSKQALQRGQSKAWNEFVAKKARASNKAVAEDVLARRAAHLDKLDQVYEEHDLLTVEQEELLPQWQWQRIFEPASELFYFHCPATGDTLWTEPYLINKDGVCEDPSCDEPAAVRCVSCVLEHCASCDMVVHAYGAKRNHKHRAAIPDEEVAWRNNIKELLSPKDQKLVAKSMCADPVELARRHLVAKQLREQELPKAESD